MLRLFTNANYQFIEKRRIAYALTLGALLLTLIFGIYWETRPQHSWLNYNVDFTGGTLMQVKFNQETSVADLRDVIERAVPGTEITEFGADNEFLVRAPRFTEEEGNTVEKLRAALDTRGQPFEVVRTEAVGPKVGSELQRKAAIAVILSLAATLVYLAFRFEWRFGLAAVIATAHDTILTLGFISIFQLDVSLTTVAAVLTVLGFSLHDTIIIFDRVREDIKKSGRRFDYAQILNKAINETLPRTILTVITTEATLLSLALFGGETVRAFALIMFVGILLGTYSSIFVASPVLYEIVKRWGQKDQVKGTVKPARVGAAS